MIEHRTAKPFLKWAGGKSQLISAIEKVLPANIKQEGFTYIEPFVGSGAVLFWVLNNFPNVKRAVINDINEDLITTYRVIALRPKDLIFALQTLQNEFHALEADEKKAYFYQKRALYNLRGADQIMQAALFIFMNRTCLRLVSLIEERVQRSNWRYKRPTICDVKISWLSARFCKRWRSCDFEQTLKFADDNLLFYFDPPYKPLSQTSSLTRTQR